MANTVKGAFTRDHGSQSCYIYRYVWQRERESVCVCVCVCVFKHRMKSHRLHVFREFLWTDVSNSSQVCPGDSSLWSSLTRDAWYMRTTLSMETLGMRMTAIILVPWSGCCPHPSSCVSTPALSEISKPTHTELPRSQDPPVVQLLSPVWLFATLWTAAHQAPLSFPISQSLLRFMSFESVMLSNYLILCL